MYTYTWLLLKFTGFLVFTGCITNYPFTTFSVKNNSGKTIHFKASVPKRTSAVPFEMTVPFTVLPGDDVFSGGKMLTSVVWLFL